MKTVEIIKAHKNQYLHCDCCGIFTKEIVKLSKRLEKTHFLHYCEESY